MKILLVEDDELVAARLAAALIDDRHMVNIATDGQMGLMLAETYEYDLVVLDDLIPRLDGVNVCRRLRSQGLQMPILLLAAKDSQTDKIVGLDAGADDYMVKPFDLEELRARIRALLRRRSAPMATVLTWEQLCLDPGANLVTYAGSPITLTPKEFGILELFLRHPQRVFSRSAIIDRLWSLEESPAESAVTTHIKDLRQKLKAGGMTIDVIETVYGLGYRLKLPSQSPSQPSGPGALPSSSSPSASIQRVLDKFRHSFMTQVAVLQQAEMAQRSGQLTEALRQQARQEAHKLAGSLGIFGYPGGSQLAQAIEQLLNAAPRPADIPTQPLTELVTALQQTLVTPGETTALTSVPPIDAAIELTAQPANKPAVPPSSELPSSAPGAWQAAVHSDSRPPIVRLITHDHQLVDSLQAAADAWNMHIDWIPIDDVTLFSATQLSATQFSATQPAEPFTPDAVVLDLSLSRSPQDGLLALAGLMHCFPQLPVLVLSERDNLGDRVGVSRLGGKAFLPKPVTVDQVFQAISQVLPQAHSADAKVLIVDDDPTVLTALKTLLQPWGLQVTTLTNPKHFWDVLVDTQPDLVVVDLEMPTFSGVDLCQVVRHDPRWGDLPILVITAHTSAAAIRQVFAAGADDFIAKPVVGPELVTRIISRLERVRSQRFPATGTSYRKQSL
jgi:DNA-binding response OmpR family regulator